jgi:MFS transporter, ACS family, glucarate transporter
MQEDLHIDPVGWGWVTGIFTLSYCLFEIPTGAMGDHRGPRRVLTRIVLWWSVFTALTGTVTRFPFLLLSRFLFGAGEAGVFPNAGIVVSRWFPPSQRATLSGINLMACQAGGALAPLLVVPIQMRWGWRASFFVFGSLGLVWAALWYFWFRDSPAEKLGQDEVAGTRAALSRNAHDTFSWRAALHCPNVVALLLVGLCYVYVYNFFQTWFHTFLVKGRGFSEGLLVLSALPFIVGGVGNLLGGLVSDSLVTRLGRTRGRRLVGVSSLSIAAALLIAIMLLHQQTLTVVLLAGAYGAITFQQSVAFGVCLDLDSEHAGSMTGLFNTLCQLGGLVGSVAYGYLVSWFGNYDAPFVPMVVLLVTGAVLWSRLDASQGLMRGLVVSPAVGV